MNKAKFGKEAQEAILAGAEVVLKAVGSTLGAKGRNVIWQRFGRPKISNDGVSIAKAINLADPFESMGAELLKEGAEKTVAEGGDGTTTNIVLTHAFYSKGIKLIEAGHNPMTLRRQIEKEMERVMKALKDSAIEIKDEESLNKVATISVEDVGYGKIIADAIRTVGNDGIVVVEEESVPVEKGIRVEEVNGYRFPQGFTNPYLVTDPDKMKAVFPLKGEISPVHILVSDKQWNLVQDLFPLIEELKSKGVDKLLIIADQIDGELEKFFVVNRLRGTFHGVIVKTPFNKAMLEDIAALTGATAITQAKGIVHVKAAMLGTADRIVVTEHDTTIIGGAGNPEKEIEALRVQIEDAEVGYEKEKLQERLSKLTGKTVVLHVGSPTETETRYLKDKIDDAVGATRAAVEDGVVAGGGMALARIAKKLYGDKTDEFSVFMYEVLLSPVDKIMRNAGEELPAHKISSILSHSETAGYDALAGHMVEDIVAKGIIDPVKVTRAAFKNAASLASMMLTAETAIAEIPENETRNS